MSCEEMNYDDDYKITIFHIEYTKEVFDSGKPVRMHDGKLMQSLSSNQRLIMALDSGLECVCMDVTNPAELDYYWYQYSCGAYLTCAFRVITI